ncbi:MAG: N-acetyl-alpha-D-glucosaminyl L-malate synthase BshA [Flavobacteriaceae bacterium]|nr:N-acetyl-alpha-D-glucosaminyl L-malate synthase BshA [Flavobacteriaceae bacterium]
MKIAIVCYPTFGGSGVIATELGLSLSKEKNEVHFITYKQPVRLESINPFVNFHEVVIPKYDLFKYEPYELALSNKLVEVIKRFKIELMHVHYAIPHAYAAYMAQKMLQEQGFKVPIITTLHGTDITLVGNLPVYKQSVNFSINNSDYITTVSESLKNDTLKFFDINKEITVIPNFIDFTKYEDKSEPCERSFIAKKGEIIITHISNFRPLKRVMDVLRVFKKIRSKLNVRLIMIGDGPDKEKALKYVNKHKINKNVVFLGNSNEIDKILCFTDLFLLPSEQESFGLAALEAMVHKVPVVCSAAGGLSEVVENSVSGFLCPIGDINAMAKRSFEILSDQNKHAEFKENAFKRARSFDIKKILPKYISIYKKAINL